MVVGDQDGFDAVQREVVFHQGLHDLLCADAHIHKHTLVLLAHIIAVAAAPGGEAAKDKGRKTGEKIHSELILGAKVEI